ncbi:PASTA domain-containing protein [Microbispora sp. ATCC PTA-5024]|uniref:PASTA domain-containing protein n=1 Tax=Microbispora sp. ATCC PTA-5024 TaxID=316330 RepID=UPI0003DC9180|nr:PASTA domain-containing protein [Microbispora sp. ATCC PTA-5024]ETK32997.1 hypothetical protein MPTA5024_27045 [Microbispora sp. ATCC PTA-5024]
MGSALDRDNVHAFVCEVVEWVVDRIRHAERLPRRSRHVRLPDLTGLPVPEARLRAMEAGVTLTLVRTQPNPPPVPGMVIEQSPDPERRVRRDSAVTVWLRF